MGHKDGKRQEPGASSMGAIEGTAPDVEGRVVRLRFWPGRRVAGKWISPHRGQGRTVGGRAHRVGRKRGGRGQTSRRRGRLGEFSVGGALDGNDRLQEQ